MSIRSVAINILGTTVFELALIREDAPAEVVELESTEEPSVGFRAPLRPV